MGPAAASPGEMLQLWFGCLLHCPGAHSTLGEKDAGECPVGFLRY